MKNTFVILLAVFIAAATTCQAVAESDLSPFHGLRFNEPDASVTTGMYYDVGEYFKTVSHRAVSFITRRLDIVSKKTIALNDLSLSLEDVAKVARAGLQGGAEYRCRTSSRRGSRARG